jgi:hypothetical protein
MRLTSAPYENLRHLMRFHRAPATEEFDQAASFMLNEPGIRLGGFPERAVLIDEKTQYGLMILSGLESAPASCGRFSRSTCWETGLNRVRLADMPSADVKTTLVDVGDGSHEADYSGKDVRGKIVLADGVLARVQQLAVATHGAVGIVSDMPNQTTAWSGLDRTVVRWGHLDARAPAGFAFMISRETAASLRARLALGEPVVYRRVKAIGPGRWTVVSGTIPGRPNGRVIVWLPPRSRTTRRKRQRKRLRGHSRVGSFFGSAHRRRGVAASSAHCSSSGGLKLKVRWHTSWASDLRKRLV